MFFAGAFEKFGVGVQVTRVGKYKSAVEPFIRQDLSPENREQFTQLMGDIWADLLGDIAAGRGLTPADVQAVVDREGIVRPEIALESNWVSRVAYRDEVLAELKELTGVDEGDYYFTQIDLADYARMPGAVQPAGGQRGADCGRVRRGRHRRWRGQHRRSRRHALRSRAQAPAPG